MAWTMKQSPRSHRHGAPARKQFLLTMGGRHEYLLEKSDYRLFEQ
jgi:hypothetical protein